MKAYTWEKNRKKKISFVDQSYGLRNTGKILDFFPPIYPARIAKGKDTIKNQETEDRTVLKKTFRLGRTTKQKLFESRIT
jgi:hypothetical protein